MDRNALAELLQALESRRDAEERRREERYTALIERVGLAVAAATTPTTTPKQEEENKRKEAEQQSEKLKRADRTPRILQLSQGQGSRWAEHPLPQQETITGKTRARPALLCTEEG
ncbi:UNVERIFIED_CONTAM: hypothetical protein FKN15_042158 [Acipenser sinensis]